MKLWRQGISPLTVLFVWIFLTCPASALERTEVSKEQAKGPDSQVLKTVSLERVNLERLRGDLLLEEERLKQVRKEIEDRLQELKKLRKDLESEHDRLKQEREKEMKHLVKVYEAMTPEEVAPLLENMNQKIAVDILSRMKDKKAGGILEFVGKKKAVKLSEALANRKAAIKPTKK